MPYKVTTSIRKIASMRQRLRILQGGSSAGKTIGIMTCLIDTAQTKKDKIISVVSETIPHLKRGAIRDFVNIMKEHGYYQESSWNRTDFIYTFPNTNTKIEFFSADKSEKVRGPRRDILFLNEANNINYETYTQLAIRTNDYIFIDFNPVSEFWVHDEIINKEVPHDFNILTYKDNEGLPETIVKEIESRKGNKNFWTVYGLGLIGESEGKIFTDWALIDEIPHEARLTKRGLDFGYTNDPTSIVAVYEYNGGFILDEELYQKGMSNKEIADYIKNLPNWNTLIKADSAEPKSIDELLLYGLTVLPANKGQGSVNQGIQRVQDMRISVTKSSTNMIKEYRNYMWETDKDGKILNVPIDAFNHTLDALRYAMEDWQEKREFKRFNGYQGGNELGFGRRPVYR
jgi:phage terminase large subunit